MSGVKKSDGAEKGTFRYLTAEDDAATHLGVIASGCTITGKGVATGGGRRAI